MTEQELIHQCRQQKRSAQEALFQRYSPRMMGVLRRYLRTTEDVEDVLIEGFFKVMTNIDKFKEEGSFEGWIRRIMVNEALMFLRKRHNFKMTVEISDIDIPTYATAVDKLAAADIHRLINSLPTGYRTIFNLYVIEGYKHREIADMLGISINTSKSQLILAKKKLKTLLEQQQYPGVEKSG